MKIIYYKKPVDVEASAKSDFLLGLTLLIGGISTIKNISEKLSINQEALENASKDNSIINSVSKINNLEWYDMKPEDLNFGPFKPLSIDSRIRLQNEWRQWANTPEVTGTAVEAPEEKQAEVSLSQNILARTLFYEARGDGATGMRDVASVIYNRSRLSGRSMVQEAQRRNQFSCWNKVAETDKSRIIDESKIFQAPADVRAWNIAEQIASEMISGSFNPTIDADNFHTPAVWPNWSRGRVGETRGSHIFYKIGY